jgi:ABC-type molybdenum transport system ATPase subunit/photorepair protein PhrA
VEWMRQWLSVARCLLTDLELLILDEPANGLDPAGILEFRTMARAMVAGCEPGSPPSTSLTSPYGTFRALR